ncbi:MAG: DNA methyltransferase [Hyphomicrobiales bacterium]|nr:DNA methyltransferase [Hyphomicrobiales bacterium]
MEQWQDESIDLIYLDPPFNSNADYNRIFKSGAQIRAYTDIWQWGEAALRDYDRALACSSLLARTVQALEGMLRETPMFAYLCHLAPRLHEMHRLLKRTGSMYLHCDDTSGHYIKLLLDAVFRPENYKNHITWQRAIAHNDAKRYGRIADFIFFYTKSNDYTWNGSGREKTLAEIKKAYPLSEKSDQSDKSEEYRYRWENLTGPLHNTTRESPSAQKWKTYDVFKMGRCWSVPRTGAYADYIAKNFIPHYHGIESIHARLDALDEAGLIHHPKSGKWPKLKRYAAADTGLRPQSIILKPTGFHSFNVRGDEYLNFKTQKPEGLIRQFVKASSNPGDIVLDPYCGCGTTIHVCRDPNGNKNDKGEERQFIGIDITHIAISVIEERFKERLGEPISVRGSPEDLEGAQNLFERNPFQFEAWAVSRLEGFLPNEAQTGDKGVDGEAYAVGEKKGERLLVLAQVKGGKTITPDMARAFIGTIRNRKATLGVFIIMRNALISKGVKAELAKATVNISGERYPQAQIFSIEDYFDGKRPNLPKLVSRYMKSGDMLPMDF